MIRKLLFHEFRSQISQHNAKLNRGYYRRYIFQMPNYSINHERRQEYELRQNEAEWNHVIYSNLKRQPSLEYDVEELRCKCREVKFNKTEAVRVTFRRMLRSLSRSLKRREETAGTGSHPVRHRKFGSK